MPRGISEIPELRLEVLNKLVTKWKTPPNLVLTNMFGSENAMSSTIKWESQVGNRGMTPFVPPGAPAPQTAPPGVAAHSAEAAYWKEKAYYDEEFLNNIRKEGTEAGFMSASARLARDLRSMRIRSDRRKEFMFAKMVVDGALTYVSKGGTEVHLDYDLPSDNQVSLGAAYYWQNGPSRDILSDIMDGKVAVHDACGAKVTTALCNSTVLKYMAKDSALQTFLAKQAYGDGNLFGKSAKSIIGVKPEILAGFLGLDELIIYDERYTATEFLTADLAAAGTTVYVGDASDFSTGTATIYDVSAGTSEEVTISAVNRDAGTLTVAATTNAFEAGEDYIQQVTKFVPDNKFIMMAKAVDGQAIASFQSAPFAVARRYGLYVDRKEDWDPEGVWIRTQNKGLPVLYHRDAIYQLTIGA